MSGTEPMRELSHDDVVEMGAAFVLGALDAREAAAVRAHLATCAEDHAEIAELGAMLPVLAETVPVVEPPAALKGRILAAAAAEAQTTARTPAATQPVTALGEPIPFPAPERTAPWRERASPLSWAIRIAAVVAILALGATTLLLRNQLDSAEAYQEAVTAVIDLASQPGSLTAVLTADGDTGTGLAAVSPDGQVTIAMQDLAPTTGSTVYSAWVIGGDGVPVDIGSFTVGRSGTAGFTATGVAASSGTVLALTRETGPGATTPTMPIIS
ncbi:MAG: anti-sigma factor domain-containing protein, partial [Chloroflexota bacterium]